MEAPAHFTTHERNNTTNTVFIQKNCGYKIKYILYATKNEGGKLDLKNQHSTKQKLKKDVHCNFKTGVGDFFQPLSNYFAGERFSCRGFQFSSQMGGTAAESLCSLQQFFDRNKLTGILLWFFSFKCNTPFCLIVTKLPVPMAISRCIENVKYSKTTGVFENFENNKDC